MKAKKSPKPSQTGTAWHDKWYAGMDPNDDNWQVSWRGQSLSRSDRDQARRWAANQKPRGGLLRRLLG